MLYSHSLLPDKINGTIISVYFKLSFQFVSINLITFNLILHIIITQSNTKTP
jgi:hypothetical protein